MEYKEFRRHLGKAGLKIKDFAKLIGLSPNSITNYASKGEVPVHIAIISALLGEMVEQQVDFNNVLSKIEIRHKKPRGLGHVPTSLNGQKRNRVD